jgi:MFS family permease
MRPTPRSAEGQPPEERAGIPLLVPRSPLPPAVKAFSAASLANDFASEMVYPLLPAFLSRTLGAGPIAVGALDGIAELVASVVKWVSGRLADRPGWRAPLVVGGYAVATLVRPLMAVAVAAGQVLGLRAADRVGKGLRSPARDAMIADVTPVGQRGSAFGFHRAADHFGAVLGSLAAWWLLSRDAPVRTVLALSVVPGVVAVWFALRAVRLGNRERGTGNGNDQPQSRSPFPVPRSPSYTVAISLLAALALSRIPEALLLLRLDDVGVAVALVPLVWAGLHVVRTLSAWPGGMLADRFGAARLVAVGGLLFALLIWLMGRAGTEAAAVGVFLSLGLASGLTEPAERALVARLGGAASGRAFGGYHALTGLAALPAALAFGGLYQKVGAGAALTASAVATGLLAVAVATTVSREG